MQTQGKAPRQNPPPGAEGREMPKKDQPLQPGQFIKGDLELRRIWGGCWAKWIAPRSWQAPKKETSPGYMPYVLDQVKTMACSRNQHRRGTALCEKGSFDYHPAVLGFPLLNARKHSRNQLPHKCLPLQLSSLASGLVHRTSG